MFFIDFLEECDSGWSLFNIGLLNSIIIIGVEHEDTPVKSKSSIVIIIIILFVTLSVTLSTVLSFVTGAEEIPPLGFPHDATLHPYPTASTCAIQLTVPSKYTTYEDFRKNMNHGGFGLS